MATSNNSKSNKSNKVAPAAAPVAKAAPPTAPAAKPVVKPPVKASTAPQPAKARVPYEPTQEEIQSRAFELYVSEGCKEGHDLEYWVRAEKELRSR
jgi:hypothetical protein